MPCNWSTTANILLRSARTTRLHFSPPLTVRRSPTCGLVSSKVRRFGTTPVFKTHPPHSLSSALASATAHLSDAQVSRVAAQAVRLCIREGDFGDALYVVNSACHSVLRDPVHPEEHKDSSSKLQPIAFGRPVSPRLAAHAFLHGLVRKGYALKAQTYAKLMVQAGIPIQRKTMETVIASIRTPPSVLPRFGPFARVVPKREERHSQDILRLQPGMVTDACSRAAVELLQTARTFGQQRTERMYYVLVSTLLMQGEIIVATLLFALLIKDWEVQKVHEVLPNQASKDWITYEHLGVAPVMGNILDTIDRTFVRTSHSASGSALLPSLQSLALLAMFLDTASLIRTMYHCPKTDARLVHVKAYPYFHDVLKRLRPPPILSRRAYNSLLSYSLRHQFSPAMATKVLNHMCVTRSPPIPPDTVTYNLHISETALAALRSDTGPLTELMPEESATANPMESRRTCSAASPQLPTHLPPSDLTAALAQANAEKLELPQEVNTSTLTTFVTHLTSTGRPESITPLSLIDHPATSGASLPLMSKMSRQQALRRAAQHGPYAGEVGLAERAERASHIPSFGAQPWRLSCYARRSWHYLGSALLERDRAWRPKARHYRQGYAQQHREPSSKRQTGMRNAMLLYRSMMSGGRSLLHMLILSHTSRPMATTPRRPPTGGEPTWFVLLPDERFFNAALKLFSRPVRPTERQKQDGSVPARYSPLLRKLARAVVSNGYSIPERWKGPMTVKRPRRHVCRPYAFPPLPSNNGQRMANIPTVKTRGLPVRKKMPAWMRRRRTHTE
ncbi:hypothetical protein C8T65DRAFT_629981 [Cerioporus squamosus]|nr:hypothetical protein C8T65DRAFT_629981 [Cerioporus squamosus]